jgi:hypothetical protein
MRFVLFLLGLVLGVTTTLAYTVFVPARGAPSPDAPPLPAQPPITVMLGEPFLTSLVQRAALDAPGVTLERSRLRVEPRDETLLLHATVEMLGQRTSGTAVLRPTLADGALRIEVVETNLGLLPVPALDRVLEEQINARLRSLLDGMPVTFTGVRIESARGLTVTARVDLDRVHSASRDLRFP